MGEDEFTVGRLHPMMDNDLRIRRFEKESHDPEVAVILLDVVLGYGAHSNPASELAPVIAEGIRAASENGRKLEVVAIVSGTDQDPQGMQNQIDQLLSAGARVEVSNDEAARWYTEKMETLTLKKPVSVVNISPVIGANVGIGAAAIAFLTD